jgi:hypothetical protein
MIGAIDQSTMVPQFPFIKYHKTALLGNIFSFAYLEIGNKRNFSPGQCGNINR